MDFHSLSRKELQALCKKNKIPANITNVAMANALAALPQVEGLEEFLNPVEPVPDEKDVKTPDIHRTACRTSTRRKAVREEPESCQVSTRLQLRTRAGNDQENKDLNAPITPAAVPSSRRRAPAVPKTPAASSNRVRATSAYNTRRSVRLLEKNLSKINITDTEETGSVKVDGISQQIEDSADTEKVYVVGASLQTVSAEVLEKTNELEVTCSEKNAGYEWQSNGSTTQVQLHPEVVNGAGASLQDEPQDSNSEPSISSGKCYDAVEVSECCDKPGVDSIKSIGKQVDANKEAGSGNLLEIENSCDPSKPDSQNDAFSSEDVSVEVSEYSTVGNDIENLCSENKAVEMDDSAENYDPKAAVEVSAVVLKENELSTVANDVQNFQLIFCAENKAVEVDDLFEIYAAKSSSGKKYEILEDNTYPLKVVCEELEAKVEEYVEKDASSENSTADIQVCCIEASSEGNMNVQSVTGSLDSSLVRNEAEAESKAADFKIECKEDPAAAEATWDAVDQTVSTMTCVSVCNEQKKPSDVPTQLIVDDQLKCQFTCQAPSVRKEEDEQKENLNNDDLHKKSIRELKRMLKNLSLDGKTIKSSNSVNKEVERKRTALQALPENQMTVSNDG